MPGAPPPPRGALFSVAVRIGRARLIDNILIVESGE
jgi:pantothenate synthetase